MKKIIVRAGLLSLLLAPIFVWAVVTPNDPLFPQQWALTKIQAPLAWETTTGSSTVTIAILDSGINPVADLKDKIILNWNAYDNGSTTDVLGHGTMVASAVMASSNNGIGIASPCWGCRLHNVRISDVAAGGYGATISSGLTWAADHGARVANVSYGLNYSDTVTDGAKYFMNKGGIVIMPAGNEGLLSLYASEKQFILIVGATTNTDQLASFSNSGADIDLVAPGGRSSIG